MLTTIHPLGYYQEHALEREALRCIRINFGDVAKLRAFRELEDEIHNHVIDEVARWRHETEDSD
jgi:hypothetical protein